MTDEPLSDLFAEGTAPESDPAFALKVAAGIGRARLGDRLGLLAVRTAGVLALFAAAVLAAGLFRPVLGLLVDESPQFMGVPAPLVLAVLTAGLALTVWRHGQSADAGVGPLEPID